MPGAASLVEDALCRLELCTADIEKLSSGSVLHQALRARLAAAASRITAIGSGNSSALSFDALPDTVMTALLNRLAAAQLVIVARCNRRTLSLARIAAEERFRTCAQSLGIARDLSVGTFLALRHLEVAQRASTEGPACATLWGTNWRPVVPPRSLDNFTILVELTCDVELTPSVDVAKCIRVPLSSSRKAILTESQVAAIWGSFKDSGAFPHNTPPPAGVRFVTTGSAPNLTFQWAVDPNWSAKVFVVANGTDEMRLLQHGAPNNSDVTLHDAELHDESGHGYVNLSFWDSHGDGASLCSLLSAKYSRSIGQSIEAFLHLNITTPCPATCGDCRGQSECEFGLKYTFENADPENELLDDAEISDVLALWFEMEERSRCGE